MYIKKKQRNIKIHIFVTQAVAQLVESVIDPHLLQSASWSIHGKDAEPSVAPDASVCVCVCVLENT